MEDKIKVDPEYWRDDLDDRPVMVSIRCTTYNHETYIREALEGFVKQQTNFRFEAIVHDDASTDGTAAIIREYAERYPSIIKPIYETENQYSKRDGSLTRVMSAHIRGKYIAFCEGDDYWTDPLKLQKQVDFLESNSDYGLVHTDFNVVDDLGNMGNRTHKHMGSGKVFIDILRGNYTIGTLTVLLRRSIYENIPKLWVGRGFGMGDLPCWIEVAHESKIGYLSFITSNYRYLPNSASHNLDIKKEIQFQNNSLRCKCFYIDYYGCDIDKTFLEYKLYCELIKISYLKNNVVHAEEYYKKLKEFDRGIPLKTQLFYWGCKSKLVVKLINLLYVVR